MNVVIADDEQIILKWLKKNIEELSPEYQIVGTCVNGKQVLSCCLDQKVDILFTDIRMPVMDGLELLKKLGFNHIMPYTIVLSAYSDFAYVRDAFKLGAKEFLLKPEITKENLERCLNDATLWIKHSDLESEKEQKTDRFLEFLDSLFNNCGNISQDLFAYYNDKFSDVFKSGYSIMLLRDSGSHLHMEQIEDILKFLYQEEKKYFHLIPMDENKAAVISEVVSGVDFSLGHKLSEYLLSFGLDGISVSVSDQGKCIDELSNIYTHAEEVDELMFFYDKKGFGSYNHLKMHQKKVIVQDEIYVVEIQKELNLHLWQDAQEKLWNLIMYAEKKLMPPVLLKQHIMKVLMDIYWTHLDEEQKIEFDINRFFAINDAQNVEEFNRQCQENIIHLFDAVIEKYNVKVYSDSVNKVLDYIAQNYSKEISLDELADHVHLNRSYLSSHFKKEMGVNIYAYLLEFRLEKAKELLRTTNKMVQEICYDVGMPDSAYFSKQFKKMTGESPLEFRKLQKEHK